MKHERVRVVAGCGERLPLHPAQLERVARCHSIGIAEALGRLAGVAEHQGVLVPCGDDLGFARGDADAAAVRARQSRVSAHVIGMAVGIDQAQQGFAAQGLRDQAQGMRRVRAIAAVDQHRALVLVQQDAVARQPVALDDLDLRRKHHGARFLEGNAASKARFCAAL